MKDLSEKNQIVRGNEREVGCFVEKKKMEVRELERMWRDEGDEENEKENKNGW